MELLWIRWVSEVLYWNSKSCKIIMISVSLGIISIGIPIVVELLWCLWVWELFWLKFQELWNHCDFREFGNYSNWNPKSCGIIAISVSFGIIWSEILRVVELLWFRWVLELLELKLQVLWNYCDFGKFGNDLNWNSKRCGIIESSLNFGIIWLEIPRVVALLWFRWIGELS